MKAIEKFFESTNFDHKNILNRSTTVLKESDIEVLENEGATFELLESLNVPVYKYRTQITIHGLFPDLKNNYIGGYKNLFQNKNLSIGVKYNAIDRLKKEKIFSTIKGFLNVDGVYDNRWIVTDNSTEYSIYKMSERFNTKSEYLRLLPIFENEAKCINKDLFFGNVQVYDAQNMAGQFFLVLDLNIGAIKNENVVPLIQNVCNCEIGIIEAKIQADKEAYELKQATEKAERDEKERIKQENAKPYFEKAYAYIQSLGYEKQTVKLFDGIIVLVGVSVVSESFDVIYKFRKYNKTKSEKKFRYINTEYRNEIPDVLEFVYNGYSSNKSDKTEITAYVKNNNSKPKDEIKTVEVKKEAEVKTTELKPNNSDIRVVEYSEKSFAVIGNTKPIKDVLLQLGGKYNRYLTVGIGWIFSNKKKNEVMFKLGL